MADLTPADLGRIARSLSPDLQDALRRWARKTTTFPNGKVVRTGASVRIGAILDGRKGNTYRVDPQCTIGSRGVASLVKRELAEEHLLWLCLTTLGERVANWLGGIEP